MQIKRVMLVSVAVAAVGIMAAALGFAAERANSKSFGGFDGRYCVYRRTAALGCGVAAAVFLLAGQAVLAAASGCFGRCGAGARARLNGRRRTAVVGMFTVFWTVSMACTVMLLYGARRNAGRRTAPTRGRYHSMYGCTVLKGGVFSGAAVSSAIAFVFGITGYVYMETAGPEPPRPQVDAGVSMGQPYFQPQADYPPAMGYPAAAAAAPPPPYGGYGAKAPAGPA